MVTKNVFLRQSQFRLAAEPWFCLKLARKLVMGKIRNQRTMLLRNHTEPPEASLREMKEMALRADSAGSPEELLGIEGNAARLYFGAFDGMLKAGDEAASPAASVSILKGVTAVPRATRSTHFSRSATAC